MRDTQIKGIDRNNVNHKINVRKLKNTVTTHEESDVSNEDIFSPLLFATIIDDVIKRHKRKRNR